MKKRFQLPLWFPTAISWLKAFNLAWLMILIFLSLRSTFLGHELFNIFNYYPEISIIVVIVAVLSPIFIITSFHHLFRLTLESWLRPKRPPIVTEKPPTLFPGLVSWWQGVYGWLVLCLSTLITGTLYILVLAGNHLDYATLNLFYQSLVTAPLSDLTVFFASFTLIWFTIATFIYHLEYLWRQHFLYLNLPYVSKAYQTYHRKTSATPDAQPLIPAIKSAIIKGKGKLPHTGTKVDVLIRFEGDQSAATEYPITQNLVLDLSGEIPPPAPSVKIFQFSVTVLVVASLSIGGYRLWEQSQFNAVLSLPTDYPTLAPTITLPEVPLSEEQSNIKPTAQAPDPQVTVLLPPDPFQMAIDRATNAVNLSKVARSKIEWQATAIQWQDASELMKLVPGGHPQYVLAQQKAAEYRQNLIYAQQKAASYPN